jgi:hypothetical protein
MRVVMHPAAALPASARAGTATSAPWLPAVGADDQPEFSSFAITVSNAESPSTILTLRQQLGLGRGDRRLTR